MSCGNLKFKTAEASSKARLRTVGAIDKYLNILDYDRFNVLNNQWTEDAKKRFNVTGKLFYTEDNKAIPNKLAFKIIDNGKGIYYQISAPREDTDVILQTDDSNLPTKELHSTVINRMLSEQNESLSIRGGQAYVYLNDKDAERFAYLLKSQKGFPKEFKVQTRVTRYKNTKGTVEFPGIQGYANFQYIKSNNNKKSNLYDIIDIATGEVISEKARVIHLSRDVKSEIAERYGAEYAPTKVFNANRSIAFTLYIQKPSKAKYIAQAKRYLYDALKFLPNYSGLVINLDKIEGMLESFPEEMWNYINTTYAVDKGTDINASISLRNEVKFNLPKLGLLKEVETLTDTKLEGVSFKNFDRSGRLAKRFRFGKVNGGWGETITIDSSKLTRRQLKGAITYYLQTKGYFKGSSVEQNVKKYAEHNNVDPNKLNELVFGNLDTALENVSFNYSGNSDTMEVSKWRERIRNYNWQAVELFNEPYKKFEATVKERITKKFKDKRLQNGISHLDYFFSGNFNWLNINLNSISGKYFKEDLEEPSGVGVQTVTKGVVEPFEMKIFQKPKAGEDFLDETEVFNRLAAILHEPFHALHALSYGTEAEKNLRKAFDSLQNTVFGRDMLKQVFGDTYNNQILSQDVLYKEFTAYTTQLMLFPKNWITQTDLRSNDIYEYLEKIQNLQDKTYTELRTVKAKIGIEETIDITEEQIQLNFLEKLYNYIIEALNNIISSSENFFKVIASSKLVSEKVIKDVFQEEDVATIKTEKLPEDVKKSKEVFLEAMDELKSALNTLMSIDASSFSSKNVGEFFNKEEGGTDVMAQTDGMNVSVASPATIERMKVAARQMKINLMSLLDYAKSNPDINVTDVNGIADLSQGIIAIAEGREDMALTEELIHIGSAIYEEKYPEKMTALISKISDFKIYNIVLQAYKGKKAYQLPNGKPNIRKIKKEAVDKLMAEVLIKDSNGSTQFPELSDLTIVGQIKQWWSNLLSDIRKIYRESKIDIFRESAEAIVQGDLGTVDDISSTGIFSQASNTSSESENVPLADLYKRLTEEDSRLTLYGDDEIPGKKRHYTYKDPITGEEKDVHISVTQDIKLQKEKKGRTFDKRSEANQARDADKIKWGKAGHNFIEQMLKVNLIDKETGLARAVFGTTPVNLFNLEQAVHERLETFIKELVRSYPPGTRFLAEPMVINKSNTKRTMASAIDFVALIPVERNGKPDVKVEMLDWKFTTRKETDKVDDIPWYNLESWKSQMGEYTKMLRHYGMKNYQLQKARMVPFIVTYDEEVPGFPGRGEYASQIEIGKVDSLKETDIHLLPVPIDIEPTGITVVDKLLFELNAYYQRNYIWDGKLSAAERDKKDFKLNTLKVAIRKLQVSKSFKPLVIVAQTFLKDAQDVLDKFATIDYEKEDPKVIRDLLAELSSLKMDSFRFEGINKVFLEAYKDKKEFDEEDNKILQDLSEVSGDIEKMLVKIVEAQNERAKYIGALLNFTTEEEGDSMLNPSREIKDLEKLFREGSKLPNKRAAAIAALVLQAKNEVELVYNNELVRFNKLFKPLYALASAKGVSVFSLIGKIGKAGNTKDDAEDTLQIYDKVKPSFMKELKKARTGKDKEFITTHIDMKAHNKAINAEMKRQEAELRTIPYHPNSPSDNDIAMTMAIDKMRNSLDIYRATFNGWNTHFFLETMFKNVKENDPKYQTEEYKTLTQNPTALAAWEYVREWTERAKDNGHIPQWKDAFFPLIEADAMAKFLQSKRGVKANIKEYMFDAVTGRIDESKSYSHIDPETGEARESIPVYFTKSDKDVDYMTQDVSKAIPMWMHSIIDFEASLALESDLNLLVDVEENVGVFIVDAKNKIQRIAGKEQVTDKKNSNIPILRGQVSDAIYGQREDTSQLMNVKITALANRLTKIFGRSENLDDQIVTEIRIKKVLEGANNWVRNLGVGLKPAIAVANTAGQLMLAYIHRSGVYRYREYANNTIKVLSTNLTLKERGMLHFISAFSENNITLQRRLAKNGLMSFLNTWSMTDMIQVTNSFPELILQKINGLSMMENTIVIDGKLVNVRELVLAEDRATKENNISQEGRKALHESYEARVAARKASETKLIDIVEVSDDGVKFPGVSVEELARLRARIMEYSRKLNGQMDENDKAAYKRSIILNSFMMFKHWVPKLLEGRFHGIHQNLQSNNWEYGRSRLMAKTLLKLMETSIFKIYDLINQTEEGMKIMDQMLEEKMISHFDKTGEVLQITKEEWYDLMRQELDRQFREIQMVLGVFALFIAARAAEPPENISARDRSRFNYLLRIVNKVTDEILFFYNPTSFEGMTTGSIMPAVTILSKANKIFVALWRETVGDEEAQKKAHFAKHLLNIIPVGYQVSKTFIPLVDAELAKEMGNAISKETNRR